MMIEILTGVIICILLLYLFSLYLDWGDEYAQQAQYQSDKKNSLLYKLTPPTGLADSKKYLRFLVIYYYTVATA